MPHEYKHVTVIATGCDFDCRSGEWNIYYFYFLALVTKQGVWVPVPRRPPYFLEVINFIYILCGSSSIWFTAKRHTWNATQNILYVNSYIIIVSSNGIWYYNVCSLIYQKYTITLIIIKKFLIGKFNPYPLYTRQSCKIKIKTS